MYFETKGIRWKRFEILMDFNGFWWIETERSMDCVMDRWIMFFRSSSFHEFHFPSLKSYRTETESKSVNLERQYLCHDFVLLFVACLSRIVARNTCRYSDNAQSIQPRSRVNMRLCAINLTSPSVQCTDNKRMDLMDAFTALRWILFFVDHQTKWLMNYLCAPLNQTTLTNTVTTRILNAVDELQDTSHATSSFTLCFPTNLSNEPSSIISNFIVCF